MDKPYIIIHTHTSIDGNIDIMDLFEFQEASRQYQELAINPEKQQFGIQKMMVGGGGTLNWSFIQKGLADEVSMILAPIANADPEGHRFFVAKEPYSTIQETAFQLKAVEELEHGTLWIRYAVKNDGEK